VAGKEVNWGPAGSRTLKPDLELLEPIAIILLIPRTFIGIPSGGRMNSGRDHGAEKSASNEGKILREQRSINMSQLEFIVRRLEDYIIHIYRYISILFGQFHATYSPDIVP
jgi:hypothetical protein